MNCFDMDGPLNACVDQGLIELFDTAVCSITPSEKPFINIVISTKSTAELEDKSLFHVKVHSSHTFDLIKEQKNGFQFPKLCPILRYMQSIEDESHLCVQSPDPGNGHKVLQTNYTAVDTENGTVIQCSDSRQKKGRGKEGSTITLRVYQQRNTMMLCCKRIHHYLRLFSFTSPQIHAALTLKIQDYNCHFDFRDIEYNQRTGFCGNMCNNANYILRDSSFQAITPCLTPHTGDVHTIPQVKLTQHCTADVKIQAVACVINCKWQQDQSSLLMVSVYGPHKLPLLCRADDLMPVVQAIPWADYNFNIITRKNQSNTNLDADAVLNLQDLTNHRRCHYCIIVYLFIDHEKEDAELGNWLRQNHHTFLQTYHIEVCRCLRSAVTRALTFRVRVANDRVTKCYRKAIPCIAKSVSNILLRSSNEEFRRKCFKMLNVETARLAEVVMTERLWQISKCCIGVVPSSTTGQSNNHGNKANISSLSIDHPSQHATAEKTVSLEDPKQSIGRQENNEFSTQRYCTQTDQSESSIAFRPEAQRKMCSLNQQSSLESSTENKISITWESQNGNMYQLEYGVQGEEGTNCFSDLSSPEFDQIPDSSPVKPTYSMQDQSMTDSQKNSTVPCKAQDDTDEHNVTIVDYMDVEEQAHSNDVVHLPVHVETNKEFSNTCDYKENFEMSRNAASCIEEQLRKPSDHPKEDDDQWFEDVMMDVDKWLCED